jgi:hypothetical protein
MLVSVALVTWLLVLVYPSDGQAVYELTLPPKKLKVCDNIIVNDIEGGAAAVLEAGKLYLESIHNNTVSPIAPFQGAWKWEMARIKPPFVPECKHLHVFGDERKNYDEVKRFCYFPNSKGNGNKCNAYSIGSNNKWDFEEYFFRETDCTIDTFDCTCNATVPAEIVSRTKFHQVCLGNVNSIDEKTGQRFLTLPALNKLIGRSVGPDYYKMDIEGYEWTMLKSMVKAADTNHELHSQLPLQIYAEYHLDRESLEDNSYVVRNGNNAYVGKRLRYFWDELFLKGGYMIMHMRNTVQTRNMDLLIVKVFCPVDEV